MLNVHLNQQSQQSRSEGHQSVKGARKLNN